MIRFINCMKCDGVTLDKILKKCSDTERGQGNFEGSEFLSRIFTLLISCLLHGLWFLEHDWPLLWVTYYINLQYLILYIYNTRVWAWILFLSIETQKAVSFPLHICCVYTVQTAIIWHCSFSAISLILMSVIFYQPDPASV